MKIAFASLLCVEGASAGPISVLEALDGERVEICSVSNLVEKTGSFRQCEGNSLLFSSIDDRNYVDYFRPNIGDSRFLAVAVSEELGMFSRFEDLNENAVTCLALGQCTSAEIELHYGLFALHAACPGRQTAFELQEINMVLDMILPPITFRRLLICEYETQIIGVLSEKYVAGGKFEDGYLGVYDSYKADLFTFEEK